jgi:hypothetical protein
MRTGLSPDLTPPFIRIDNFFGSDISQE